MVTPMTTTRIHLAKPGTYRDAHGRPTDLSADRLKALADSYVPGTDKAPLVLGHPKDGAPAYGWIDALEFDETAGLYGTVSNVATDLAAAVERGAYRNVSISIYPKGGKTNPTPEREALRHVGVLGAQVPAIRGLEPLSFADDGDVLTIEFSDAEWAGWWGVRSIVRSLRDLLIERFGAEDADRAIPSYLIDSIDGAVQEAGRDDDMAPAFAAPPPDPKPKETPRMSGTEDKSADFAEREADIARREAAIKVREDDQAKRDAAATEAASLEFADGLIGKGLLAPAKRDAVAAIHRELSGADAPLSFSDGKTEDAAAAFEGLFSSASPVIDLAERSTPDQSSDLDGGDPDALAKRAKTLMKEDDALSFAEAIRQAEDEAGDAA